MKVAELIGRLQRLPHDATVHIEQPTHNYWRNVAVVELGDVGEADAFYSDYLTSLQLAEPGDDEDEDRKIVRVVTLSVDA